MDRRVFCGICLAWILSGPFQSPGQEAAPARNPLPRTAWPLPPLDYFVEHLPPPPRPGSFRDRMDLNDVVLRQKAATDDDLISIQQTYLFNVFYFSNVLGPDFNPDKFPKTAAFFAKLAGTATAVVGGLKNYYRRPRPFEGHPDQVQLKVKNEPGFGYPSGHTARSRLAAFVMAELAPEYKRQFFAASEQVATDRILAGEHYLTDLEAGRRLGKSLFLLLSEDPQFQADLAELKAAEWSPAKARLTPVKPLGKGL